MPQSWIPPEQILELRSLVRLRRSLVEQRTAWLQRIHAQLFHHGLPVRPLPGVSLAPGAAEPAPSRAEPSPGA